MHMIYHNFNSTHQGLSNAPSPNIVSPKLTGIAHFKVCVKPSYFPYFGSKEFLYKNSNILMQNFKKSKNQIPSIEFAINHQNSSNIPSSHVCNLIMTSEHPYWYTTHWLKSGAQFHWKIVEKCNFNTNPLLVARRIFWVIQHVNIWKVWIVSFQTHFSRSS